MIALDSVFKRYGSKTVIHDVSFTVEQDEIVGFLGPNGAGKTTTLRMIAGFTAATAGDGDGRRPRHGARQRRSGAPHRLSA